MHQSKARHPYFRKMVKFPKDQYCQTESTNYCTPKYLLGKLAVPFAEGTAVQQYIQVGQRKN
jgi:hypothetical protein